MIRVIHAQIYSKDFSPLDSLARDYSSCVRFSYSRFKKDSMEFSDVRRSAKAMYPRLNTRQISDAAIEAQGIHRRNGDVKVVFGGRKLAKTMKSGESTSKAWKDARDCRMYSRGDTTKSGNPNLRVVGDSLRVTVGNRKFEAYKMFFPRKYRTSLKRLLDSGTAYNVRIMKQDDNHWRVAIDYETTVPAATVDFNDGAIGVDTNPDRIAVAEVSSDGNYISSKTFVNSRLKDGSKDKRMYDVGVMAKSVVAMAKQSNKGVVIENLEFKNKFGGNKKFNRMKSNFLWRKFTEILERRCLDSGIACRRVNPAYTSVIGRCKYAPMYKTTAHEAAAFTIARRGLGFGEKISVNGCPSGIVKQKIMGTLEEKYHGRKVHSWVLWSKLKAALTGPGKRMRSLQELRDHFLYDGGSPSGEAFLQELVAGSDDNNHSGGRKAALQG
jgi:IS605 OrfB family transposase